MKKAWNVIWKHGLLIILSVIWMIPILWLFVTSLSGYKGINTMHFFPQEWTLDNYKQLFFEPDIVANFPAWFKNSILTAAGTFGRPGIVKIDPDNGTTNPWPGNVLPKDNLAGCFF